MKHNIMLIGLLVAVTITTQAQISKQKIGTRATPLENPTIAVPAAGSVLTSPFVMVGRAKPGAQVTIHVTPVSKNTSSQPHLVVKGSEALYSPQDFTVTAEASGRWQSPPIEVKFYKDVTDKKIQIFTAQAIDGKNSGGQTLEYKAPVTLSAIPMELSTNKFAIQSPVNGALVGNNAPITGTAKAGSVISVIVYSGYFAKAGDPPRKGPTQEFHLTAGTNGKWSTDNVNFNVNLQQNAGQEYSIIASVDGTTQKQEIKVKRPNTTNAQTASFQVLTQGGQTKGINTRFVIKGLAEPGTNVEVVLTFNGTRTLKNNIFNGPGDKVSKITDGDYGTLKAKANVNGEWGTDFIATQKRTDTPGDPSVWFITQANIIKAQISVVDNSGKRLKTENRMWLVMP
jgi:hypothetical protein